ASRPDLRTSLWLLVAVGEKLGSWRAKGRAGDRYASARGNASADALGAAPAAISQGGRSAAVFRRRDRYAFVCGGAARPRRRRHVLFSRRDHAQRRSIAT